MPHKKISHYARRQTLVSLVALLSVAAAAPAASVRAQTEGRAVAVVNGRAITQAELDGSITAQLFPLQQQIYALRKAALDNLILRELLAGEAKKRGVTAEELRKRLTGGEVSVAPAEVERLYLGNVAAFASMSPEEARERLRLDLESQARMRLYRERLAELRRSSSVEVLLEEPRLAAPTGSAPSTGPAGARVVITEYADFQCPFCRDSQAALKRLLREYGTEVRLVFRHLPLDLHPHAFAAARAAACAERQNSFWPYHDALFAAADLAPASLAAAAASLGLDAARFKACLDSEESRTRVLDDMAEAKRLGISGTPAFIINGRLLRGALTFEQLREAVERELRSAPAAPRR